MNMNLKNIVETLLGNLVHQVVYIETRNLFCRAHLTDGRIVAVYRMSTEEAAFYQTPYEVVWS